MVASRDRRPHSRLDSGPPFEDQLVAEAQTAVTGHPEQRIAVPVGFEFIPPAMVLEPVDFDHQAFADEEINATHPFDPHLATHPGV